MMNYVKKKLMLNINNNSILSYFLLSKIVIMGLFLYLFFLNENYFRTAFLNFDATHYYDIATLGYIRDYQLAFFPLFPLVIRFFNLFGIPILGGLLFNTVIHYLSTLLIYKFSEEIYKNKDTTTHNIIILWLFSPIAFFNSILYSESLFIFLSLSAFYLYKKNKHLILSGVLLGLAVCTRSFGAILFFTIFIMICIKFVKEKNYKNKKELILNTFKIYIPATLLSLAYPFYLFVSTGSWKSFINVQFSIWHRVPSNFFTMTIKDLDIIFTSNEIIQCVNFLNFIILWSLLIFIVYLLVVEIKKKRLLKLDLMIFLIGVFLSATSTMRNDGVAPATCSLYRYLYSLFPLFLLISDDAKFKPYIYLNIIFELIVALAYFNNIFLC